MHDAVQPVPHPSRAALCEPVVYFYYSSGTTLRKSLRHRGLGRSVCSFLISVAAVAGANACASRHAVVLQDTAELGAITESGRSPIHWYSPAVLQDARALARWRTAVGPPVIQQRASAIQTPTDNITVVSWNIANGEGDVAAFARTLSPGAPLVMLLQEAYRGGAEVPSPLARDASFAGRLGGARSSEHAEEIESVAEKLDLNIYYVPSMRNGGATSDEDRGNAILSNLALTDLIAVELPFERQRRVAIAATVGGRTVNGVPWRVRVVSAHLDNMAGARRAWVLAEHGRARQARGLTSLFQDDQPTILAGDFNTWFGFSDQAYLETARAFPDTRVLDRRATFRGLLRLDHVFVRLAHGWRAEFRRAGGRFGSDHYPLVGTLHVG